MAGTTAASAGDYHDEKKAAVPRPEQQKRLYIEKHAGDYSRCPVRTPTCRFTVRVLDERGKPVGGVRIVWRMPPGGPRVTVTDYRGLTSMNNILSSSAPVRRQQTATIEKTQKSVTFTFDQEATAADKAREEARAEEQRKIWEGFARAQEQGWENSRMADEMQRQADAKKREPVVSSAPVAAPGRVRHPDSLPLNRRSADHLYETAEAALRRRELSEAVRLYEMAARKGSLPAMVRLGDLYHQGRILARDLPKALYWYKQAGSRGHGYGLYMVGVMYRDGQGVARNPNEAIRWLRQASSRGYAPARKALNDMGVDLPPPPKPPKPPVRPPVKKKTECAAWRMNFDDRHMPNVTITKPRVRVWVEKGAHYVILRTPSGARRMLYPEYADVPPGNYILDVFGVSVAGSWVRGCIQFE